MKLKLSEAIMLGSTTCKMIPGDWNSCALGAAANSVGMPRELSAVLQGSRTVVFSREDAILAKWPWLHIETNIGNIMVDTTTGEESPERYIDVIYSMFDDDVCTGKMSLEQLVDYVRAVEPDETVQKMDKEAHFGIAVSV